MIAIRGALAALLLALPLVAAAQPGTTGEDLTQAKAQSDLVSHTPDVDTQIAQLRHALVRLPIAAGLASVLALRPRRRGTPHRQPPVIQTQIILSVVGAVVMLVVGSSL